MPHKIDTKVGEQAQRRSIDYKGIVDMSHEQPLGVALGCGRKRDMGSCSVVQLPILYLFL